MHAKNCGFIGVCVWIFAALATSLSFDTIASSLDTKKQITTVKMSMAKLNMEREIAVISTVNSGPALVSYTNYARPDADDVSGKATVSQRPAIDGWKLLAAILGLVGMRLWHAGKKSLPVID